jgi:hypothetical protein
MQSLAGKMSANLPYLFVAVGVVWLALAVFTWSPLLLWPVVAFAAGGMLLRASPFSNLTAAWAGASSVMGLILSVYQVYVATSRLGGQLAEVAWTSLAAFAVFALVHLYLLVLSSARK